MPPNQKENLTSMHTDTLKHKEYNQLQNKEFEGLKLCELEA